MLEKKSNIPLWKRQFWKLLYKIYASNKGVSSLLRNRITPFGYIVAIVLIFAISLRLGSNENTLFGFIACIIAIFVMSFFSVFFRRGNLSIKRKLPRMGVIGKECVYSIEITNESRRSISSAYLRELPSRQVPSEDVFVYSVEPGEEERNAFDRLFIVYRWMWLTENKTSFYSIDSDPIRLEGKESMTLKVKVLPRIRGILPLSNMKLLLPDPLFLFQRCKTVQQPEDSIIIFPKRYRLRNLKLEGETHNQVGGEGQSNQIGQSSEFISLRDYRPGDPLKHLDWKSWAKTGKPVVRQYEDVFYPKHGLVLDTAVHPTSHEAFEEAISVAASFACSVDNDESLLDLVLIQKDSKILTAGNGGSSLDEMMEALACAQMETTPEWEDLTKQVLEMAADLSSYIMVFSEWSEERAKLVNMAAATGTSVLVFLLSSDVEASRAEITQHGVVSGINILKVGQVQEDLDRALGS